jgi:hypothetical protein
MKKADIKRPTRMETTVIKRPTISYICLYRDIVTPELLVDNAGKKGSFIETLLLSQPSKPAIWSFSGIPIFVLDILGLHLEKD